MIIISYVDVNTSNLYVLLQTFCALKQTMTFSRVTDLTDNTWLALNQCRWPGYLATNYYSRSSSCGRI